jgi:hypothetical protein
MGINRSSRSRSNSNQPKLTPYQVVNMSTIQIDMEQLDEAYAFGQITAHEYLSTSKMMEERLEDVVKGKSPYDC